MSAKTMVKEVADYSVQAIEEDQLDGVLAPLTAHGHRPSPVGWLAPQGLLADVSPDGYDERSGQPVSVRNPDYFNPGTVVKLSDGQRTQYSVVVSSRLRGQDGVVYLLDQAEGLFSFESASLSAEMRHPVNVNHCSRRMLELLMEGIEYTEGGIKEGEELGNQVSYDLASEVAQVIIKNRPIRGIEHLIDLLGVMYHVKRGSFTGAKGTVTPGMVQVGSQGGKGADMSAEMALAIVQNAINPVHRSLRQSTMPFCFVSQDYYTVETASSINDAGGNERARFRLRETFRVAPPRELLFRLDTQADFENTIVAGRYGRYTETHPKPLALYLRHNAKPEARLYRNMLHFDDPNRPGFFADTTTGDVRLQPSRLGTPQGENGGFQEHFDGDLVGAVATGLKKKNTGQRAEDIVPEGYSLSTGPYSLPLDEGSGGGGGQTGASGSGRLGATGPQLGAVVDGLGLRPFVVEFYMKPEDFGSDVGVLSMIGADTDTDYIRAYYDGGEETFRFLVHDNAEPQTNLTGSGSNQFEEAVEIQWKPESGMLEDDTWYHISLHVGGASPGEIALFVDGFKRGGCVNQGTLQGNLSMTSNSFDVDPPQGYDLLVPDEGPFWIGTEIVYAKRVGGNSFEIMDNQNGVYPRGRGARGTEAISHGAGEVVRPFGYSAVLTSDVSQFDQVHPQGGGQLEGALNPLAILGIAGPSTPDTFPAPPPGSPISVEVLDLQSATEIQLRLLNDADPNASMLMETFQSGGGYALIVAPAFPSAAQASQGSGGDLGDEFVAQIVRYQSFSGSTLTGITAVPANVLPPELADGMEWNVGQGSEKIKLSHASNNVKLVIGYSGAGTNSPSLATIMPLSVGVDDASTYHEVVNPQNPSYAQLIEDGSKPTFDAIKSDDYHLEWVAYFGIDLEIGALVCANPEIEQVSGYLKTYVDFHIPAPSPNPPFFPEPLIVNGFLRWRGQAGTSSFGYQSWSDTYTTHSDGREVIPTFRTTRVATSTTNGEASPGYGDSVTFVSFDNQYRIRRQIAWTFEEHAAFTESLTQTTAQLLATWATHGLQGAFNFDRRQFTRIIKYPSGELPDISKQGGEAFLGVDTVGGIAQAGGLLDEVRLRQLEPRRFVLWDQEEIYPASGGGGSGAGTSSSSPVQIAIDENSEGIDIPIANAQWVPNPILSLNANTPFHRFPDGREVVVGEAEGLPSDLTGLVLIDDEVLGFVNVGSSGGNAVLQDCRRGLLGTMPQTHSYGSAITFLDWREVTKLANQVDPEDYELAIADALGFNSRGGTVRINDEMLHYGFAERTIMRMPRRVDRQRGETVGIFRGRYGTQRGSHDQDSLVIDWPFRYWDRYEESCDDPELGFYELSITEPRAFFRQLAWSHEFPRPRIGMKVLCRFDSKVPWDTPVDLAGGKIRLFDSKSGQTEGFRNRQLLNVNGKGVEVRVFFTFEENAFDPDMGRVNDWKETPRLLDFDIRYLAAPFVISRETLK